MMHIKLILFSGLTICAFALLITRLIHVQVIEGGYYLERANANRTFAQAVTADRGVFLDRYQKPLVYNTPAYFLKDDATQLFSDTTPLSQQLALKYIATQSAAVGYTIERVVTEPSSLSSVVGYIGPVTADDLKRQPHLLPDEIIGKTGLEKNYDHLLQGVDGSVLYEVDAMGNKKHEVEKKPGIPGKNVSTSIDPYLSRIAAELFQDKTGAFIIIDADTGGVLSLISSPSYDASVMNARYQDPDLERQRREKVSDFLSHPKQLFFNRAISGTYPPGSVFKLITALAGLETAALDATTVVRDEGVLKVGDEYSYANWYYTQYGGVEGEISLQRAIARSNDIYFYKAAEWIGPERLSELASVFGLGKKTGIELPQEAEGIVPTPEWKEKTLGERWFLGNTYHLGIGQDNLLVTPIQIAQLVQAIGNTGKTCSPHIVVDEADTLDTVCSELGISQENLELVLKGMLDACSTGGTAFPFFAHNQQLRDPQLSAMEEINKGAIACKTGTAEFGGQDEKGHRRTHAWFTALVGTEGLLNASTPSASLTTPDPSSSATDSARVAKTLHEQWLAAVEQHGFPRTLVLVSLVESDEIQPFREGSKDSAPLVAQLLTWMKTGSL